MNPRCQRTAPQERHPDCSEMICGKCFRMVPDSLRRRHKQWWRRERRLKRLLKKATPAQVNRIETLHYRAGDRIGNALYAFFHPTEKPEGLDRFLEEMGLS